MSLVVTAFGIWLFWIAGATFGLFVAGLGLLSAVGAFTRAVDGRPQILLRVDGVFFRALSMTIPWNFILDVSVGELRVVSRSGEDVERFLLVKVRDPLVLARRIGPLRLHKRVKGGTLNTLLGPVVALVATTRETVPDLVEVPTADLDVDATVVAKAILERLDERRNKGEPRTLVRSAAHAPSAPSVAAPAQGPYRSQNGGTEPVHFPAPSSKKGDAKE